MTNATYTKLRDGSWGIRVQGTAVANSAIQVSKKDGSSKTETIGRVLWSGNGVSLCTITKFSSRPTARRGYNNRSYGREDCRKYGWDGVVGSSSYYSSGQYDEDS